MGNEKIVVGGENAADQAGAKRQEGGNEIHLVLFILVAFTVCAILTGLMAMNIFTNGAAFGAGSNVVFGAWIGSVFVLLIGTPAVLYKYL